MSVIVDNTAFSCILGFPLDGSDKHQLFIFGGLKVNPATQRFETIEPSFAYLKQIDNSSELENITSEENRISDYFYDNQAVEIDEKNGVR